MPRVHSRIAASTLAAIAVWKIAEPTVKQYFILVSASVSSGGNGVLFLAIVGVLTHGAVLDKDNPAAGVFRAAAGEVGFRVFGVILWSAAISSVVGAAYTSVSFFKTFHPVFARYERVWPLIAEAIDRVDTAYVWDNSRFDGPDEVALFVGGFAVGSCRWPTWTPTALARLGSS